MTTPRKKDTSFSVSWGETVFLSNQNRDWVDQANWTPSLFLHGIKTFGSRWILLWWPCTNSSAYWGKDSGMLYPRNRQNSWPISHGVASFHGTDLSQLAAVDATVNRQSCMKKKQLKHKNIFGPPIATLLTCKHEYNREETTIKCACNAKLLPCSYHTYQFPHGLVYQWHPLVYTVRTYAYIRMHTWSCRHTYVCRHLHAYIRVFNLFEYWHELSIILVRRIKTCILLRQETWYPIFTWFLYVDIIWIFLQTTVSKYILGVLDMF